jgi:hypothetical protein
MEVADPALTAPIASADLNLLHEILEVAIHMLL